MNAPSPAHPAPAEIARTYLVVVASVALSTLARFALTPLLGSRAAFIVYFPALVLSAWVGGWGGGLVALALSTLAATYYFLSPMHTLAIPERSDQVSLLVFVIVGLSVSALSSSQRKARQRAEKAAADATRTERALRDSEARKSAVLEVALDCIIAIDEEGKIVEFNPAAQKTFGYTSEEAIGRPISETVIPPALRRQHHAGFAHYLATGVGPILGHRIELVGMRKSGEEFPVELSIVPMKREGKRGSIAYLRDISERKALEQEQAHLADTNRLLLDSTGEGIYGIDLQGRFTFVNRAAAQMLGFAHEEIIGRNGHALIHHARPDGTPYPEAECPIFRVIRSGESARVEGEVFWRADGVPFPVAYSAAPIIEQRSGEQGTVRGAVVTFFDISERQALDRERARLTEREHRIAEQLQQALQPAVPASVPGLELADYYQPALEEAGVGGDFSDVFAADKGVTFLVVGDLSGKGLAAASQVATVRNMLRFALYNGRSLAGPVTTLSRTLVENDLLTGFATLFVGRFDAHTRLLSYVNCGQDAGLVLRAETGQIEELPATGPVLGGFPEANYTEQEVRLESGDVLALYTDGLTEAGPTRTSLLTGEGVAALLRVQVGQRSAPEIVLRLIAGVDDYAQSGLRDDQCLLVGIVT
jgi:PAS domain S-box-containing protein